MAGTPLDLAREAVVYRALAKAALPIPALLAVADDGDAILLAHARGDASCDGLGDDAIVEVSTDLGRCLADLHLLDPVRLAPRAIGRRRRPPALGGDRIVPGARPCDPRRRDGPGVARAAHARRRRAAVAVPRRRGGGQLPARRPGRDRAAGLGVRARRRPARRPRLGRGPQPGPAPAARPRCRVPVVAGDDGPRHRPGPPRAPPRARAHPHADLLRRRAGLGRRRGAAHGPGDASALPRPRGGGGAASRRGRDLPLDDLAADAGSRWEPAPIAQVLDDPAELDDLGGPW